MRRTLIALSVLALTGCQTVRIQGVEITKENQRWALVGAIAATIVAHQLKDDNDERREKCARYVSVPVNKGPFICEELP